MAEYIEREALLRWFEPYLGVGETWVEIHPVLDAVHAISAADVVEVVRCKDCKRRELDSLCEYFDDNDFCCRGERRADNGSKRK